MASEMTGLKMITLRAQCRCISRTFYSRTYTQFPGVFTLQSVQSCVSLPASPSLSTYTLSLKLIKSSENWLFSPRGFRSHLAFWFPSPCPLTQVRSQLGLYPWLTDSKLAHQAPFCGTLPSMKSNIRRKLDQRIFMEQVQECMTNGYLLSSKKIGSGAFSKVYLAYATRERMKHNPKLASDLRAKHHTMVAIKIVSMAEAPVEYSRKFLPREISSLNATYKHLNIVQLYETYQNSQRSYLVLELAARGDLLEHINAVSDLRCCPGLEEEEARRLFWQLVSAVAHCHNAGIVHRDLKCENVLLDDQGFLKLTDFGFANFVGLKNSLLSTFCGSVAYTAPEILMSKKYNGEQADLWSLGIILHAMVSGKLPFKEHQPHRMLHLIRRGPIFKPGLSPECRDLIRGLLQLHPCARLGLQQVAAHCWMLPAEHTLSSTLGATPEQEHSQSAIARGHTESGRDMVYQKQKLQDLQRRDISKESVSGPGV